MFRATSLLALFFSLNAFAISQGPLNYSSASDDGSNGGSGSTLGFWSIGTPNHVTVDSASGGTYTDWLILEGFNFSIPSTATIQGIFVEVHKYASNATTHTVKDNDVRLIQSNAVAGTNKATSTTWPLVANVIWAPYGGSSDLWGLSWAPADINASTFGVAIAAQGKTGSVSTTGDIDGVRITVYYLGGLASSMLLVFP